ncbi:MAG: exodeoxyribonuclease VII small subunit [Woeseiaceae bacterium]
MTATKKFNLEKSLTELEELVEELETGDLPLEKAMKKFEDGIKLTRGCQNALKEAEQKVEILLKMARRRPPGARNPATASRRPASKPNGCPDRP